MTRHPMTCTITPDYTDWRCALCGRHVRVWCDRAEILAKGARGVKHRGGIGMSASVTPSSPLHVREGHD